MTVMAVCVGWVSVMMMVSVCDDGGHGCVCGWVSVMMMVMAVCVWWLGVCNDDGHGCVCVVAGCL